MCRWLWVGAAVVTLLATAAPVLAQDPTPVWPTPIVTGEYVVRQEVTYGEGGVIVALLFLAGVVLLQSCIHIGERVKDR